MLLVVPSISAFNERSEPAGTDASIGASVGKAIFTSTGAMRADAASRRGRRGLTGGESKLCVDVESGEVGRDAELAGTHRSGGIYGKGAVGA